MVAVRWRAEDGLGIEHAEVAIGPLQILIDSVVVGDRFGPHGVRYRLQCAPDWSVRGVEVDVAGGPSLRLASDGEGNWKDSAGSPLQELQGCLDVDISATPLTNTLPIRRLRLAKGERREISVVYIPVPSLAVTPVLQAYTCLIHDRRYRYEGLFRDFETELNIDIHGLVTDYPTLFRRML